MSLQRRRLLVAVTTVAIAGALAMPVTASAASHPAAGPASHGTAMHSVALHSAHGVTVKSVKRVSARQLSVQIVPKALGREIGVQIILPAGYQADSQRRYPVLYLFPGTSGHSTDWTTVGDALTTTKPYPLITVSSDIGFDGDGGGWFTNWVDQHTKLGKSQWETYDIHELIPWIDANLDTIAKRSERAVAGLSQGGYGSTELAARHPELFTMMMSFSGAPEIDRDPMVKAGATAVIDATMVGLNGVPADAPFGDPVSDNINWEGHDPAEYIDNLRGMALWFATADGLPGKYDDPVTNPSGAVAGGAIESATHVSTTTFIAHLKAQHVPYLDYDYGSGTHTWPYWARDLRKAITPLMKRFDHPAAQPTSIDYKTILPAWTQWGWHVSIARTGREFSELSGANAHGFALEGSGRAVIRTPRLYPAKTTYAVKVGAARAVRIRTGPRGQLTISVPLGSSPHTVTVRIARAN